MTFTIRPLARKDLGAVTRIDAYHTGARKAAYWQRVFDEFVTTRGGRGRVRLAVEADHSRLAGYLLGQVRAFEFGSEPCGWIFAVGVDGTFLRAGVGSMLLNEACARFRSAGVDTVRTMVKRNDVPVLSFFRTNAFTGGPYVQLERPIDGA
jgi:ribosomal protein S18 acetylase RimI-like enzyme